MQAVFTRFAPSPTGFLHIGSARTALFNYLFAKKCGGKFLLRIEDTDKQRSTKQATQALLSGLKWLGIEWDPLSAQENEVYQSTRAKRHQEVALELLKQGKAYKCFLTSQEIEAQRQEAISQGRSFLLSSPWRNKTVLDDHNTNQEYVIRFKTPQNGTTIIPDLIHGEVVFENNTIEDMVLLKSNLDPVYNLCVVVDDHDMGITHIIRGDDHMTNAVRQTLLYQALGWEIPQMAHIPLIHGDDGSKLSKRHGATNVQDYQALGYLPDALLNYIMRLGWSYQGDEIISLSQACKLFDIADVGKSCARIDFDKMKNINAKYIREKNDQELLLLTLQALKDDGIAPTEQEKQMLLQAMPALKLRAELITDLANAARIYLIQDKLIYSSQALNILAQTSKDLIAKAAELVNSLTSLDKASIESAFKQLATQENIKIGNLMAPIRCLLTGSIASPSVYEIISIIGKDTTLSRLNKFEELCH